MNSPHPALFVGHGSPMNTLEDNANSRTWRDWGARLPHPRAILAISAHWETDGLAVTAMPCPRTLHDFSGFRAGWPSSPTPRPATQIWHGGWRNC